MHSVHIELLTIRDGNQYENKNALFIQHYGPRFISAMSGNGMRMTRV